MDHFNLVGKQGTIVKDFISVILWCKIEVMKNTFVLKVEDINKVENLINEKKLAEANRLLSRIFYDQAKEISGVDENGRKILTIGEQIFGIENQLPDFFVEGVITQLAKSSHPIKNLTNASLVCRQWNRIVKTPPIKDKVKELRIRNKKAKRLKVLVLGPESSKTLGFSSKLVESKELNSSLSGKLEISKGSDGIDLLRKLIVIDEKKYLLELWNFGSINERFHSLLPMYFRGADIVMIVFSLTQKAAFSSLRDGFIEGVKMLAPADTQFVLIGDEGNVFDEPRKVTTGQVLEFAKTQGLPYFECSTQTGKGIDSLVLGTFAYESAYDSQESNNIASSSNSR